MSIDVAAPAPLADSHRSHSLNSRPRGPLLKWVGNKFQHAELIANHLPRATGVYYEPFVGTGAVAATLRPERAVAADTLGPLIDFFKLVQSEPASLLEHYDRARNEIVHRGRDAFEEIKARFNASPNPHDLLVISRTCYGGVMRFTLRGVISTPLGPHKPMPTQKLADYMVDWQDRLSRIEFLHQGFDVTMEEAGEGDVVYCDPPYAHGQSILYGAQSFRLAALWDAVAEAVDRGAKVAVSADGFRRSGSKPVELGFPEGLFKRELLVERGGCMLRRFQPGAEMASEQVSDRLLLSW